MILHSDLASTPDRLRSQAPRVPQRIPLLVLELGCMPRSRATLLHSDDTKATPATAGLASTQRRRRSHAPLRKSSSKRSPLGSRTGTSARGTRRLLPAHSILVMPSASSRGTRASRTSFSVAAPVARSRPPEGLSGGRRRYRPPAPPRREKDSHRRPRSREGRPGSRRCRRRQRRAGPPSSQPPPLPQADCPTADPRLPHANTPRPGSALGKPPCCP
mmetsp:Transcript_110019/g.350435  ORF Transcript_110019/g.350435 Transcript_110019/m.350435 type:complete len:217 (-) Transcript_110019:712-1362(-)